MVKEIVICDRCGTQLGDNEEIGNISISRSERNTDKVRTTEDAVNNCDFCTKCMNSIIRFIELKKGELVIPELEVGGIITGNPVIPDPQGIKEIILPLKQKKKKVAPEQPRKPRRMIDYGKIPALANAGWDNKKIGEEMGMTPQQVSDAKCKAKKKMAAVNEGDEKNAFMGSD